MSDVGNPKDLVGARKAPLSSVPLRVVAEIGVAMFEGASKYGRHNYRFAKIKSSVYFDALMRHMFSWFEGEDNDPDSGLSHVTKAIATLVVLRDAILQGNLIDDRAPKGQAFYTELNNHTAMLVEKYKDVNPKDFTIND